MRFDKRTTCSVKDAIEATGLGETRLYELIKYGHVESVLVGGKRLIKVPSLLRLLESDFQPGHKRPPINRGPRAPRRALRVTGEPPEAA
jgi:hypothetical protein